MHGLSQVQVYVPLKGKKIKCTRPTILTRKDNLYNINIQELVSIKYGKFDWDDINIFKGDQLILYLEELNQLDWKV